MKSLQLIILLLSLFFVSQNAFAQDDFYNNPKKQKTTTKSAVKDSLSISVFDESSYLTEKQYYELKYGENNIYSEENNDFTENEDTENEDTENEHHRKTRNNQIAGEIVAEIIYNVAITFLIIWGSR